jgi:hypothetical protein
MVLVLAMAASMAWAGTYCDQAQHMGGHSKYLNILCLWELLWE